MADYHLRGPSDSWEQSLRTDDGCNARQPGCARGPVSGAVGGHASEWDPFTLARRAGAVLEAYEVGRARTPAAIVRATGLDDLPKLSSAIISGLLQMALVVAATTVIGGLAGAAIGALLGGVGAVPGAAAGAEIGFDAGMAVLGWLGLAMIAVEVARGIGEVTNLLHRGVVVAWEAEDAPNRQAAIDAAGELLAEAIARLMLLVLMAIVARLAAAQALASTERAASASADLFAMLRRSRLGAEFAEWVQANAERLMRNPSLRRQREVAGSGAQGSASATPSQLKPKSTASANELAPGGGSKPPKPAAEKLDMLTSPGKLAATKPTLAGLTPTRAIAGTNNKVAVIGQSMEGRVKVYADELRAQGYDVEIFDGPTVPDDAARQWANLTSNGQKRLTDAEAIRTKMFKADADWAAKLKKEGYTVLDLGGNPAAKSTSPFYEMEKQILFGD